MKLLKTIFSKLLFSAQWLYAQFMGADAQRYIKIAMVVAKITPTKVDDKILKSLLSILRYIDDSYRDLSISFDDMASNITENESIFRGFTAGFDSKEKTFNIGNDLFAVSYDPKTKKIYPSAKWSSW